MAQYDKHFNMRSIFTHMFSLLSPPAEGAQWPVSLNLPLISFTSTPYSYFIPAQVQSKPDPEPINSSRVTGCPHTDKKHYAKKMCINCYHKFGRTKLAWKCSHKARLHYAKGKCHLCYLHQLTRKKAKGRTTK